jgi:hypothetical protein
MSRALAILGLLAAGALAMPAVAAPLSCPCQNCALADGTAREPYPGTSDPGSAMARADRRARQVAAGVMQSVGQYCMSPCAPQGDPRVAVKPLGSEQTRGPWAEARVEWTIIGSCVLPGLD